MSNNLMVLRERDLIENPTTRLPVCLCLDTSGSMNRTEGGITAIDELNRGVQYFLMP